MMSLCDQIERVLDSILDKVLNKTLRTIAWLVDPSSCQDVSPPDDLPDIIKDIHKASMTFRELQPDLLSTSAATTVNHHDGLAKRCKSMDDISNHSIGRRVTTNSNHYNRINIYHNNNTFLHRSFDQIRQSSTMTSKCNGPMVIHRQESYHGENDIGLEPYVKGKSVNQRQCHRCCSDPLPRSQQITKSNIQSNTFKIHNSISGLIPKQPIDNSTVGTSADTTDGSPIQKHSVEMLPSENSTSASKSSNSNSQHSGTRSDLEKEMTKRKLQRRMTDLFIKHLPEPQQSGELESEGDEQLCHSIVDELKKIADSFDERHSGKDGFQALQETLNIDLTKFLLPDWLRHGIGPAVIKTSLNLALQFNRL